jgi:glycerophosphoryl diester phosphodiesterase
MELIGHRGCADQCPENTVAAVQQAGMYLDAVEVDVRRCGSGELVVFHDETVDRLTEATGEISELPWRTLRSLEVLDSGETIPRLETVLAAFPSGVRAQLELKTPGIGPDVRDVVSGFDLDVTVSSFRPAALREVDALEWRVPTGYLFREDPTTNLDLAVELGCDVVHPHYDLCVRTGVVDLAHDCGLDVVAWKAARTEAEIQALRAAGVDGVTTDRWDIA